MTKCTAHKKIKNRMKLWVKPPLKFAALQMKPSHLLPNTSGCCGSVGKRCESMHKNLKLKIIHQIFFFAWKNKLSFFLFFLKLFLKKLFEIKFVMRHKQPNTSETTLSRIHRCYLGDWKVMNLELNSVAERCWMINTSHTNTHMLFSNRSKREKKLITLIETQRR